MSDTYTCATCGSELVVTSPAELELERIAAERDTARELASDAIEARDIGRAALRLQEQRIAQLERASRALDAELEQLFPVGPAGSRSWDGDAWRALRAVLAKVEHR